MSAINESPANRTAVSPSTACTKRVPSRANLSVVHHEDTLGFLLRGVTVTAPAAAYSEADSCRIKDHMPFSAFGFGDSGIELVFWYKAMAAKLFPYDFELDKRVSLSVTRQLKALRVVPSAEVFAAEIDVVVVGKVFYASNVSLHYTRSCSLAYRALSPRRSYVELCWPWL